VTPNQSSLTKSNALLTQPGFPDLLLKGRALEVPASPKERALLSPTGRQQPKAPCPHITTLLCKAASELELLKGREECFHLLVLGSISPQLPEYSSGGHFLSKSSKQNPKYEGLISSVSFGLVENFHPKQTKKITALHQNVFE